MVQYLITVIHLLIFLVIGPFFFVVGFLMERKKFAIGTVEIANNIHFLSKVFPDSFTINFLTNVFYKGNHYDFGPYKRLSFMVKPLLLAFLWCKHVAVYHVGKRNTNLPQCRHIINRIIKNQIRILYRFFSHT